MNEIAYQIVSRVASASVFLALTGIVAAGLLAILRCRSPRLQAVVWSLVLMQGCVFWNYTLLVPYQSTTPEITVIASRASSARLDEPDNPAAAPHQNGDSRSNENVAMAPLSPVRPLLSSADAWRGALLIPVWPMVFLVVWLSGVTLILTRWLTDYVRFLRQTNCRPSHRDDWNEEFKTVLASHPVSPAIELSLSDNTGPALCRWPSGYRIVVPESLWSELSQAERKSILCHELAHCQRFDVWTSFFAALVAAIHWFNPIAWLAVRRREHAAELACDDIVKNAGADTVTSYARALLRVGSQTSTPVVLSAGVSGNGLAARIRRVLMPESPTDSRWKRNTMVGVVSCLVIVQLIRVTVVTPQLSRDEHIARLNRTILGMASMDAVSRDSFKEASKTMPVFAAEHSVPPAGEPWPDEDAVRDFLEVNQEIFRNIDRLAITTDSVRFPSDGRTRVHQSRVIARLMLLRHRVAMHDGDSDTATASVIATLAMARAIRGQIDLLSSLTRLALVGVVYEQLRIGLNAGLYTDDQLRKIDGQLDRIEDPASCMRHVLNVERALALDDFEAYRKRVHATRDDQDADLLMLLDFIDQLYASFSDDLTSDFASFDSVIREFQLKVFPGIPGTEDSSTTYSIMPAIRTIHEALIRVDLRRRQAKTAIALRLYRSEQGEWPDVLDDLVGDEVADREVDPSILLLTPGKPFGYRVEADGSALLWAPSLVAVVTTAPERWVVPDAPPMQETFQESEMVYQLPHTQ